MSACRVWAILCAGWFVCFQARIVSCVVLRVGSGLEELPVLLGSVPVHVVPRRTRHHSGRRCKDNSTILSMKYQCERSIQSGHRCHGIRRHRMIRTCHVVDVVELLLSYITPSVLLSTRPQHSQCPRCTGSVLREIPGTCVIPGHRLQHY